MNVIIKIDAKLLLNSENKVFDMLCIKDLEMTDGIIEYTKGEQYKLKRTEDGSWKAKDNSNDSDHYLYDVGTDTVFFRKHFRILI